MIYVTMRLLRIPSQMFNCHYNISQCCLGSNEGQEGSQYFWSCQECPVSSWVQDFEFEWPCKNICTWTYIPGCTEPFTSIWQALTFLRRFGSARDTIPSVSALTMRRLIMCTGPVPLVWKVVPAAALYSPHTPLSTWLSWRALSGSVGVFPRETFASTGPTEAFWSAVFPPRLLSRVCRPQQLQVNKWHH